MATKKPKGLGRGLEYLLGPTVNESPAPSADGLPQELALSDLVAGVYQPRTRMDEGA
jgi:ParB family chromosome partitioning protein